MNRAYFNGLKVVANQIPPTDLLLLDLFPDAAGAYSLRKLRAGYTGAAIRVRRSSDDAEQDIGFDANNDLDTADLLSFVGSGDGFVSVIYDQSTNANNASQSILSRQPPIVFSGVLNLVNDKPAIKSIRSDSTNFTLSTSITMNTNWLVSSVIRSNGDTFDMIAGNGPTFFSFHSNLRIRGQANVIIDFQLSPTANQQNIVAVNSSPSNLTAIVNDLSQDIAADTGDYIIQNILTHTGTTFIFDGDFQELVIYQSNQFANLTTIRSNLNNYYNVF